MTIRLEGFPAERASADLEAGAASILVDEEVYALDAVYGAAYVFIDRCYVMIDRPEAGRLRITLTPKQGGADEATLRQVAGELANELLACAWRHQLAVENRHVIETTTAQAIAGAMGPPSLEDLADFDFGEEPFEDPLGIAVPWEEKYGKKKDSGEGEGA
jgi:His-Xaa-Ser system protein HxsD